MLACNFLKLMRAPYFALCSGESRRKIFVGGVGFAAHKVAPLAEMTIHVCCTAWNTSVAETFHARTESFTAA